MTLSQAPATQRSSSATTALEKLIVPELSGNRLFSVNPDGSDKETIVTGCRLPDGVGVDLETGHIYWTNMGVPSWNEGSIKRVDLNGQNRETIVPQWATFTPKQVQLDKQNGKLCWVGLTARECASCAPIATDQKSKR